MLDKVKDLYCKILFNPFYLLGMPSLLMILFGIGGFSIGLFIIAISIALYNKKEV